MDRQDEGPRHPGPHPPIPEANLPLRRSRGSCPDPRIRPPETARQEWLPPRAHGCAARRRRPGGLFRRFRPVPPKPSGSQLPPARPGCRPGRWFLRRSPPGRDSRAVARQDDAGSRTRPGRPVGAGLPRLHHPEGPSLSRRALSVTHNLPFRDVAPPRSATYTPLRGQLTASRPPLRPQGRAMKNLLDLLRTKEEEIVRLRKEIEALKITARLLFNDTATTEKKTDVRQLLQM